MAKKVFLILPVQNALKIYSDYNSVTNTTILLSQTGDIFKTLEI